MEKDTTVHMVTLGYPTSLLWGELKTYAAAIDQQDDRIRAITKEMYGNTADELWLDYWMKDHFGVTRIEGENDQQYFTRAKHEIFSRQCNNFALVKLVKDAIGIDVEIKDAYKIEQNNGTIGRFYLDMLIPTGMSTLEVEALVEKIKGIVRRSRAAGTDFLSRAFTRLIDATTEIVPVSESYAVSISTPTPFTDGPVPWYIKVGAKWKVGTPGLKVGINDTVKEQAIVTVTDMGNSTSVVTIYGG